MAAHRVDAVMHFAAWLSVGESVKTPIAYYENNVGGALAVLRAMVEARVPHFIFSSTAATFGNPVETPITESHPQRPINAYGETKLAIERALPHFERAYGLRSVTLRYFNAAGADPDGALGEDHHPEIHVIPRAIDAALGRDAFCHLRRATTRRRTAPACATTSTCPTWRRPIVLALESLRAGGESAAYNLGNGRPDLRARGGRRRRAGDGPAGPGHDRPAAAGRSRRCCSRRATKIRTALGWTPRYEDIDVIVETAWRWREAHPRGIRDRGTEQPLNQHPLRRLLRYSRPYRGRFIVALLAMLVYAGGPGRGRRTSSRRSSARSCPGPTARSFRFWAIAIIVAYLAKGLGSYFSTYLMTDIGQRVVRDVRSQLFRHILNQSAAFFSRRTDGQLMSRITNDVGQIQQVVSETVGDVLREGLSVIGFAALMFWYDWKLAVVDVHRRAARGLSARPSRPARAPLDQAQPGTARAPVAPDGGGVRRPSDRQGVRRRTPRGRAVRRGLGAAVSHQSQDHQHRVDAAADDGVPRRSC